MSSRSFIIWILTLLSSTPTFGADGELRRQAMFGAVLGEAEDGVLLTRIIPDSSAAEGGFREGDVIEKIGERRITNIKSLLDALAGRRAGDRVMVGYQRDGQSQQANVTLKEKIRERGDGYEVIYGSVTNGGFRQRTIVTRPPGSGRHPAVLVLQGGHTCFPVDDILGRPSGFVRTAQHLARNGYVTMRIERPGCGDSEGGPLRDIDFETESAGNLAALRALKRLGYVDPRKVLIYGFSMGGFYAPLIALREPVAGIAANGTTCGTFYEGVTGQRRRFLLLEGKSPAQVNQEIIGHIRFWYQLTVERKTVREILAAGSAPRTVLDQWVREPPYVAGRNDRFYHQIAALNLAETWGKFARTPLPWSAPDKPQFPRVLTLLGEFDWHTTPGEGADWIVQTVNDASPGHATKVVLPESDHFSNRVRSTKQSFDVLYGKQPRPTAPFNPALLSALLNWCDATVGDPK